MDASKYQIAKGRIDRVYRGGMPPEIRASGRQFSIENLANGKSRREFWGNRDGDLVVYFS